ncbi:C_GCAxxG_C_C family protein [Denitrovibrio acetiphilus DSM 12809]|uniref:C_GCAxxG_C_C family protein n=1 Tax=Denitrovibrio acetiphilus (strain DSM 12809 / NBRC 114555 / N2460) TaxID=522772 RepID=D4H836_DENA2|nr:C-GCAxxG-C-C family protein [Denitrovibrio acetiphilus]ADD68185.1 C_GCAxxG_C_C family protein [Denitrovibrio acetiphilus DSM 12809]
MSDSIAVLVSLEAVKLFKSGYHCSESVMLAFEKYTDKTFSEDTKRGMSAFVEGVGGSGCICGALNSGIFILSTMGGRLTNEESTKRLERVVKTLHDDFRKEFKSACCRVITKNSSKVFGIGKYNSCNKTVDFVAMRIVELAQEEGWIKPD